MRKFDEYINQASHLPSTPKVLTQLMQLLDDPDVDSQKVVELLTYDPALTVSVIRTANNTQTAGRTQVSSLLEAIHRLGLSEIYKLIVSIVGQRNLSARYGGDGVEAGDLWRHSAASAMAAQLMAQDLGDDDCHAFTAALLHDIGKIVFTEVLDDIYANLVKRTAMEHVSLLESESLLLGAHHGEIGARLLERWGFPPPLVMAVRYHHHPFEAAPHDRLAAYVYLGNLIANYMGHSYGGLAFAQRGRREALRILNLTSEHVPQYMTKTFEQFGAIEQLFSITS